MAGERKLIPLNTPRPPDRPPAAETAPTGSLEDRVVAALKTCYDPELPVNIYELGLIYELTVGAAGAVAIRMTLTSPGCPVADSLVREVQAKVQAVPGVTSARVELVWDPPWDRGRMSEAAQLELGLL
jgi:FeS assembly SUF system protein